MSFMRKGTTCPLILPPTSLPPMDVTVVFSASEETRDFSTFLPLRSGATSCLLDWSDVTCKLCLRNFWQRADWHRSELAGTILVIKKSGKPQDIAEGPALTLFCLLVLIEFRRCN